MNLSQSFNTPGEHAPLFNGEKLPDEEMAHLEVSQPQAPTESQWRQVLGVILVEGQIRYLVARGE